jgi:hypothetical protein
MKPEDLVRDEPLTDKDLEILRYRAVEDFSVEKFTCDDCGARRTCELVFDPYNTDGDCLAEK